MPSTLRIISYRTAGSGSYSGLADETANPAEWISSFAPRMSSAAQVEALYGAAAVAIFDRGNRQWSLAFSVARQHADAEAAAAFTVSHPAALPNLVDLKIVQGATTWYFTGAALNLSFDEPSGLSTVCHYALTGIAYTTTAP